MRVFVFWSIDAAGVRKSVQSVKESCSEVTWEFQRFSPDRFRPLSQKLEPIEILAVGDQRWWWPTWWWLGSQKWSGRSKF